MKQVCDNWGKGLKMEGERMGRRKGPWKVEDGQGRKAEVK